MAITPYGANPTKPIVFMVKQPVDGTALIHYHGTSLKEALAVFKDVSEKGAFAYLCNDTLLCTTVTHQ